MGTSKIQVIIDAQDNGLDLAGIDSRKSFPLVNVLGRYKIIDFCLSNIVNAKINNVYLLVDKPNRHIFNYIDNGIYWDLNRKNSGIRYLFSPRKSQHKKFKNIDALYNNYIYLTNVDKSTEYVLFTNTDSINRINYEKMYEYYLNSNADIVWAYKSIDIASHNFNNFSNANIIIFNKDENRISSFGTNTNKINNINLDLGIFIIKKTLFYKILIKTLADNSNYNIQNAIKEYYVKNLKIIGYSISTYVANLWTISEYFKNQIGILQNENLLNEILKPPLYTHEHNYSPSYYGKKANIENSLIGQRSIIDGTIKNSIIANNVIVEKNAILENCIIFDDVTIKENSYLKNIIIDNGAIITKDQKLISNIENPLVINRGTKI